MMWRYRARVHIYGTERAKNMFNVMEIPDWARIVGWEVDTGGTLVLEFDSTDPAHFYYCPDLVAPPLLAFTDFKDDDYCMIDWGSLDGTRYEERHEHERQ